MSDPKEHKPATATPTTNGGGIIERVTDTVKDAAGHVGDTAAHVGHTVAGAASDTYDAAKHAGHQVAEYAGDAYQVTRRKIGGVEHDLAELVRRNPLPSVFVGLGVGFLVGVLAKKV